MCVYKDNIDNKIPLHIGREPALRTAYNECNRSGKGRGQKAQHPKGNSGLIRTQNIKNDKLLLAKYFRQHMTYGERCFWNAFRKNQLKGFRFRRQQVIHGFIADFYCNQLNLVVEIDGGIHEEQKDYDKLRDMIISQYGIKVLRFTNEQVIDHMDNVIEQILTEPHPPSPHWRGTKGEVGP
jgi:very-short-patch-repair endonuclease